jgi:hypothetical protein
MNGLSNEKEKALREILLNYANFDKSYESETISAILGVLGLRYRYDIARSVCDGSDANAGNRGRTLIH